MPTGNERDLLLDKASSTSKKLSKFKSKRSLSFVLFAQTLAVAGIIAIFAGRRTNSRSVENELTGMDEKGHYVSDQTAVSVSVQTFPRQSIVVKGFAGESRVDFASHYEKKLNTTIGDGLYTGLGIIVEAFTTTYIKCRGFLKRSNVRMVIYGPGSESRLAVLSGDNMQFLFRDTGNYMLIFEIPQTLISFQQNVTCRYVRRELRDLDEMDRLAYFDAVKVVYATSEEEGRAKFGEKFHSAAWLVRLHLYGAADKACDHWHDDAGFFNHHVGITLQFEKSLQAVNPNTAAHYWDYTIESRRSPENWRNSTMFSDDWFGSASPMTETHAIETGRWAYTRVMSNAQNFSRTHNPYGLLRSPWNTNPTPYILRNKYTLGLLNAGWSLPTCEDFHNTLNTTSGPIWMGDLQFQLNGRLHGPIHIMLGGHWMEHNTVNYEFTTNISDSELFSLGWDAWLLQSKIMWREGLLRCPERCSSDTPLEDCICDCPAEIRGNLSAYEYIYKSHISKLNGENTYKWVNELGYSWERVLDALCEVGHPGEMFTSAAPQDPIFWPLHGQSERFIQFVRAKTRDGLLQLNEDWGYFHVNSVATDTRLVCDWDNVTGMELPHCQKHETCPGHRVNDLLPFDSIFDDGKQYTNLEFYLMIHPDSPVLPYVYDKLETWNGCEGGTLSLWNPA